MVHHPTMKDHGARGKGLHRARRAPREHLPHKDSLGHRRLRGGAAGRAGRRRTLPFMGPSASAASAINSITPTLSVPDPGSVPPRGSCSASTKAASTVVSCFSSSDSAKGSYTMPGGTPKKTAQVEESLRRPRKRPGHSKLSGEATGTRPRFLVASHWPMLASRFVGTSETSMSSMCAMHALSDVSLRSSTEAKVLLPFTRHSLRVP
jgi:hypothetical protein